MQNVVLVENQSGDGGAVYVNGGSIVISGSIVANNVSTGDGGGLNCLGCSATLVHNDAWGNSPDNYHGLADPTGSNGNLSVDPEFLDTSDPDPQQWDLHLATGSPLIGVGDPAVFNPDGSQSDMGLYGGPDAEYRDLDWDGYHEWWLPGAYDAVTSPGMDCDDRDEMVYPGSGC